MIVVEDGTGVDGANSFITRAQAIAYASDRGVTLADDATTDALILTATAYLLSLPWKGEPVDDLQGMPFPRKYVRVGSTSFPDDQVPADVVNAQCEIVLQQNAGIAIMSVTGNEAFVIQETVGPITTKYSEKFGTLTGSPTMPTVDVYLLRWLKPGGPYTLTTRRV